MKNILLALALISFLFACGKIDNPQVDQTYSFEKIIFHTTGCFGYCPTYHLEVDSTKKLKLFAEKVYKSDVGFPFEEDSTKMGYFKGMVNDTTFALLDNELRTIGLDTLDFDSPTCCDGSVITIIVYYKGKRKFLKAMFPPSEANKLIAILYDICENSNLTRTTQEFYIENEKGKQ